MRVDIGCGADVTMPQPFLNFFQAHTIGIEYCKGLRTLSPTALKAAK